MIKTTKLHKLIIFIILFSAGCATAQKGNDGSKIPKKAFKAYQSGSQAFDLDEYADAEKYFLEALRRYPNYVDAMDGLAKTYQNTKKNAKAIHYFRKIAELAPRHLIIYYDLGDLYFEEQNIDSSEYFYKRFLAQNSVRDRYTSKAERRLENIENARDFMQNPVPFKPVNIGTGVNTKQEEYSPALTIDGQRLYFTKRDGSLPYFRQNEDIYYSNKQNNQWTTAKSIGPPINTAENEGAFSISADGKYIFFTACNRRGGLGQCDIWLTFNKDNQWVQPMNIGKPINSKHWESQPSISSDGRFLFFTSNRPGGYGGTDLYVSTFTDTGWSEPENLGPEINTVFDEQFPFIHPDGQTLYFSSHGHNSMGESDLFFSRKTAEGKWTKPTNLGYPINSTGNDWNLIVARDGKTAYFSSDKMPEGKGGMDIYQFELPKTLQAQTVSFVNGNVFDVITKKKLGATVELIPLDGGPSTLTFSSDIDGLFIATLRPGVRYALNVQRDGYLFYSEYFDLPVEVSSKPIFLDVPLNPIKTGSEIVLKNIFFDTDKFDLKEESKIELEKLKLFLEKNQSVKIEISGHTDNVGSSAHNQRLSENRAKSVREWIISNGIDASRVTHKGYGDTKPIADNSTKEGRAKNRRTAFSVM
jgi:outer membrane protein OmpA-like peptidoglycan-associated protein